MLFSSMQSNVALVMCLFIINDTCNMLHIIQPSSELFKLLNLAVCFDVECMLYFVSKSVIDYSLSFVVVCLHRQQTEGPSCK